MNDSRILLVGGAGFIGHNLALKLRRLGATVMVADSMAVNSIPAYICDLALDGVRRRLYLGFLQERFDLMRDAGVEYRNIDARDPVALGRAMATFMPTHVVHLAAIASAVEARKEPGLCFELQLLTLRNVLELARLGSKPEIMFLSSSTVYGDFTTSEVDETAAPHPTGIYAVAKLMGEQLVRAYSHSYGVPSMIIRPSALYGERCVSGRVSQKFVELALSNEPLPLEGGGGGKLDFTHIDDLVDGMARALNLPKAAGYTNTINLTFGNARPVADLATIIQRSGIASNVRLLERPKAEDKPTRGTLSVKRAKDVLGFVPTIALDEGYLDYACWYAEKWRMAQR